MADIAYPDRVELTFGAEEGNRAGEELLRGLQPGIGDRSRTLLGDEMQTRGIGERRRGGVAVEGTTPAGNLRTPPSRPTRSSGSW